MTVRGRHRLYLKKRLGFVKIALERDASLVPVYVFGETELFHHSSFLLSLRMWLMKNFGVAVPLIYGRAGLLPYAVPVTAVVGKPIKSGYGVCAEPTDEQVQAFHGRYCDALEDLFERNKAAFGFPDAILELE